MAFTFKIKEEEKARQTIVQWVADGVELAFKDSVYPWSRWGRQGAFQAARRRVTELENNESPRRYARKRAC